MTSESPESSPPVPQPSTSGADRGVIVATSIAVVATVFSLFFLIGFFSAWLKSEGNWMALVVRGLKFGASSSLGVLCIGISAKSWQRLSVPEWLPSTVSFAVGFFVMNGLGEVFDGRFDNILPKAGGGFALGACIGIGVFLAQKKSRGPQRTSGNSEQTTPSGVEN